jgi:hypothetical protein
VEAKLFYRRSPTSIPGSTVTEWTELAPFERYTQTGGDNTQITDKSGRFRPLEVLIPSPVYGEIYQFKAVAYLGNKEMPNLNNSTYASATAVIEATAAGGSALSQAGGATGIIAWGAPSLSFTNAGAQTITGISGLFLNGASVDVRVIRNNVRLDEPGKPGQPRHYDQGKVTFTRWTPASQYQTSLTWADIPAANGDTSIDPFGPDSFTVVFKYEWEKWESHDEAWWMNPVNNRRIATGLTR